ncbi:ubiquitin carboxyl-terminal hydrolase 7 [Pancytospora epiphaga]|nr:ubiquitin carboxyl-terminal hydrolase 7 [Pancytospora epiphaga]
MFAYEFSEANTESPQFELDGVPLSLKATPNFLCIKYCGKSYRDILCNLDILVNKRRYAFTYAFCVVTPWFELPLDVNKQEYTVSIDVVTRKEKEQTHESGDKRLRLPDDSSNSTTEQQPLVTGALAKVCLSDEEEGGLPGLKNLGATCYINSLLQSLYHLRGFKEHIFDSTGYHSLLLQRLFYRLDRLRLGQTEESSVYDAMVGFIKNLSFVDSVNTHQDVHEFSKMLFDRLENENKALKGLIEGTQVNVVNCECKCTSTKDDPFQDIQLPMTDRGKKITSVGESLEMFCREEELHGYRCEKHGETSARKRAMFKQLPDVLFVLINRFGVDWERDEFIKNNDYYEYPERMDLESYIYKEGEGKSSGGEGNKFRLYGVIVHSGVADEGHFHCYLKLNGRYYKFNDTSVYQACKEEAVGWNFGGKYAHSASFKNFSAYYLVYIREYKDDPSLRTDGVPGRNNALVNSTNDFTVNDGKELNLSINTLLNKLPNIKEITEPRGTVYYKYLTNSVLLGYSGPGRYNVDNCSYPTTRPLSETCLEFDNISKVLRGSKVYNSKMERIGDRAACGEEIYFVSNEKGRGKLVFIKVFREMPWCTYPLNLYALGAFPIDKFEDFGKFVDYEDWKVYRETGDGKVEALNSQEELSVGDVLIISKTDVSGFIKEYAEHELLHIYVDNRPLSSIFVKKGMSPEGIEEAIREFVSSDEIFAVDRGDGTVSGDRGNFVDSKNNVECLINSGSIFYVGIQTGVDINHITHVHLFLLPEGSTKEELLRVFRRCRFVCMNAIQTESELEVVESFKESVNVRILGDREILTPNNSFIIIQRKMRRPLKVSFYVNSYKLINYPFFIENPGSVKNLREKYFFTSKIVRFDGQNYHECFADEVMDFMKHEILLIEQK